MESKALKAKKAFRLDQEVKNQQMKRTPHDFRTEHIDVSPFICFTK